jgi:hypothetical protein
MIHTPTDVSGQRTLMAAPCRPGARSLCKIVALSIFLSLFHGQTTVAQDSTNSVKTGRVVSPDPTDPVSNCMAAKSMESEVPQKRKNGPLRLIAKSLASEAGTESSDMLKDTVFVFSAKDVDPYDKSPPSDKPYTLLEITYIDGSSASLIKYPDNSGKIVGGFADGTIIAPTAKDTFIVAYPNGVRGKLVKISGSEYKIYRPDNSITTIKKTMSGGYEITNDKIGYMGSAQPDRLGMQFEFNTKNF